MIDNPLKWHVSRLKNMGLSRHFILMYNASPGGGKFFLDIEGDGRPIRNNNWQQVEDFVAKYLEEKYD